MAKYENIRALAKKQLQAVTESSDRWKAFCGQRPLLIIIVSRTSF